MGATSYSSSGPSLLYTGELDDLSFQIIDKLLEKNFTVYLISNKTATWNKIFNEAKYPNLKLIKRNETSKILRIDYFIFHLNFFQVVDKNFHKVSKKIIEDLHYFYNTDWSKRSKNIFLFPALKAARIIKAPTDGRTIYFSETFGPQMVFADFPTFKVFANLVEKKRLGLPDSRTQIRPLFSATLADRILRVLFSFSYSSETSFLGETMTTQKLAERVFKESQAAIIDPFFRGSPEYLQTKDTVVINSEAEIDRAAIYLKVKKAGNKIGPKRKRIIFKVIGVAFALFLFTPPILVGLSLAGLGLSFKLASYGNYPMARKAIAGSYYFSQKANGELELLSNIPIVGQAFYPPLQITRLCMKSSKLGEEGIGILIETEKLAGEFMGDKAYPVSGYANKISTELDYVYEETGFILSEIDASPFLKKLFNTTVDKGFVTETRSNLIGLSRLVKSLPMLLGEEEPKKYLVLLQNNMELRPTGGYIGSFALVTLDGGRMGKIDLWDVFDADGQLKGHIEPPVPIKAYLGEANWFLRDSNWDPDFKVSAQRAEWFLDKEIDEKVDGVIATDLEFIKSLIAITGPLEISDYDVTVNAKNLYEITQNEVEKDFFPGSKKKAGFLTALSKKLIEEIKASSLKEGAAWSKSLNKALKERHLQIYFNESTAQGAIEKLGWDGGEEEGFYCGDNCYSDFFGTVEANLGVNKANQYISREMAASINILNGNVFKVLNLSIKNSAPEGIGLKGEYKLYLRLLVPKESVIESITLTKEGITTNLIADTSNISRHKETGVLIIIGPGELGVINFSWRTPIKIGFDKKGEYRMLVRKQAGTLAFPLELTYLMAGKPKITGYPSFSLTRQDYYGYNTSLGKDFLSRIFW